MLHSEAKYTSDRHSESFSGFESQYFGDQRQEQRELCFLMPTGITVTLSHHKDITFSQLKIKLWKSLEKLPGYDSLHVPARYTFTCFNERFEKEEILDENIKLCEIKIFRCIIQVVERRGDREEKMFNKMVGTVIGFPLFQLDSLKGKEEKDFRQSTHSLCEDFVNKRMSDGLMQKMKEVYPPEVMEDVNTTVLSKMDNILIEVHIKLKDGENWTSTMIKIHGECGPAEVISRTLDHWMKLNQLRAENADPAQYVLKRIGAEEYLYGEHQIIQFKYVQKCLMYKDAVKLTLIHWSALREELKSRVFHKSSVITSFEIEEQPSADSYRCLWDQPGRFSVTVCTASNVLGAEDGSLIQVKMCIYHGSEQITAEKETKGCSEFPNLEWNEKIEFNIEMNDLPRSARLCCIICSKNSRSNQGMFGGRRRNVSLGWVNIPLFDYKGVLQSGNKKLYMWDCQSADESFNFIGTTTTNTNADSITLTVQFPSISNVAYPSIEKCIEHTANRLPYDLKRSEETMARGLRDFENDNSLVFGLSEKTTPPVAYVTELERIINKNPLEDLFEDEKTRLWQMRMKCLDYKTALPKLLQSFAWNDHNKVASMKQLLKAWPLLDPECALELLDYQYADVDVRDFAVRCLEMLSDSNLSLYLLQLVQVLKYESYLDNSLTQFLLRRSLKNYKIGHFLFWHLRSEMHQQEVSVRFGLILEAYCRSNELHLKDLLAQKLALDVFAECAKIAKQEESAVRVDNQNAKKDSRGAVLDKMREHMRKNPIEFYRSPLNPSIKLSGLVIDKCKFMDSKKKPLWLVATNGDSLGAPFTQMYKSGDDLRQDMLTLQTIELMDFLWQKERLDLKMIPYKALSTGNQIGLIEAVPQSTTLASIQSAGGSGAKGAFKSDYLLIWLKQNNPTDEQYREAISNFTDSCAGYCVATYVLGIGDRHSDNIMINKQGQLFHIDFGHFLGNYKSMMGFRRERVSLVLTGDFIHVITGGAACDYRTAKENPQYLSFQSKCLEAFKILRRNSTLFINLFALMCSGGIPELSSLEDLAYLRDALCLGQSEEKAVEDFKSKLIDSLKRDHWARLNFAFHNMAH